MGSPEQHSTMVTALAQSLLISSIVALARSAPANIIETEDGQYYLQPAGGADGKTVEEPETGSLKEDQEVKKDDTAVVGCEWGEWSSLGKCKVILEGTCKKMRTKKPVGGKGGKCTSYLIDAHECDCSDAAASGKSKDVPKTDDTEPDTEVVDEEDEGDAEETTAAAGDAEEITEAEGNAEETTAAAGDAEEATEAAGDAEDAGENETTPADGDEEPAGDDEYTTLAGGDAADVTEAADAAGDEAGAIEAEDDAYDVRR